MEKRRIVDLAIEETTGISPLSPVSALCGSREAVLVGECQC